MTLTEFSPTSNLFWAFPWSRFGVAGNVTPIDLLGLGGGVVIFLIHHPHRHHHNNHEKHDTH